MSEFLKNFIDAYASETVTGVIVAIVTVVISHILYKSKLRKEQKVRFQNVVGDKIAAALIETREMQRQIRTKELYDDSLIEDPDKRVDFMNPGIIYPAIFNDSQEFFDFQSKIKTVRERCEEFLTYKEAALLIVIENYCMNVLEFAAKECIKDFQYLGAVLSRDFWKWHIYFDKVIVKDNNRQRCKLVSHSGVKWRIIRWYIMHRFWEKTVLYGLKHGSRRKDVMFAQILLSSKEDGTI